ALVPSSPTRRSSDLSVGKRFIRRREVLFLPFCYTSIEVKGTKQLFCYRNIVSIFFVFIQFFSLLYTFYSRSHIVSIFLFVSQVCIDTTIIYPGLHLIFGAIMLCSFVDGRFGIGQKLSAKLWCACHTKFVKLLNIVCSFAEVATLRQRRANCSYKKGE